MRAAHATIVALITLSAVTAIAAAEPANSEVSALLDRHAEARGGDRWNAIDTLLIQGRWTAFSMQMPFVIRRARPDRYRFETTLFGAPTVLAFDGDTAWVDSAAYGVESPQPITDRWGRNVRDDAPFGSKLLHQRALGLTMRLGETSQVEGRAVHVIVVDTGPDASDTWYLDAETHLEVKRDSMTFDVFTGDVEATMETFYMDFRDVGGLRIPHREERHFGTRYRLYEIASVEIDADLGPDPFALPDTPESP